MVARMATVTIRCARARRERPGLGRQPDRHPRAPPAQVASKSARISLKSTWNSISSPQTGRKQPSNPLKSNTYFSPLGTRFWRRKWAKNRFGAMCCNIEAQPGPEEGGLPRDENAPLALGTSYLFPSNIKVFMPSISIRFRSQTGPVPPLAHRPPTLIRSLIRGRNENSLVPG